MRAIAPASTSAPALAGWSILALALTFAAPGLSGHAQSPQTAASDTAPTGTGLILGRIVDADSGSPLSGAIVSVTLPNAGRRGNAPTDASALAQAVRGGTAAQPVAVMTDSDGAFVLRNLPAGTYSFMTTMPNYTGGGYNQQTPDGGSQQLSLADGQQLGGVALKMWKLASISGTVTDENGDPVVGVFVRVLRRPVVGGRPVVQLSGGGKPTDDRGQYRAFGLTPGDYIVAAPSYATTIPVSSVDTVGPGAALANAAAGDVVVFDGQAMPGRAGRGGERIGDLIYQTGAAVGRGSAIAPAVSDSGRIQVYPTVFYREARISSRATVVSLKSGEALNGVDMQLPLLPAMRVSGTVTGPDGPARNLAVRLIAADPDQGLTETSPDAAALSMCDAEGRFTFLGVPRGQYVVQATRAPSQLMTANADGSFTTSRQTGPTLWAAVPVSVDQTDVAGLAIALQPAPQVAGRVVFDGSAKLPDATQLQRANVRLAPPQAGAGRGGGGGVGGAALFAALTSDATFAIAGVVPGRYSVIPPSWPTPSWTLKSIAAGSVDASDMALDVTSDMNNVTITFTDKPAKLTGTVRNESGLDDPGALVVLFPVDRRAWGWPNGLHTKSTHASANGTFSFATLAPGDYELAAIPDGWQSSWQDPAFLERILSSATRIQLHESDARAQDLRTVVIK